MARADLLTSLIKYGIQGDQAQFRKVVEAIIAEERSKQHTVLAESLRNLLQNTPSSARNGNGFSPAFNGFVQEVIPQKKLDTLILPDEVLATCEELIQEHHRSDLLRSYNVEPRNRILLIGPPGNGKTSLAEAIAEALMVPLLNVRYEAVVGAYLGETAIRLRKLIEYACTRKCVLFFDEFETLAKERGDIHETGEIKRVVSSLLLQIDSLPGYVVVVGATNHAELLDRAVWRRFQVRMSLPQPSQVQLAEWFSRFEQRISIPLGHAHKNLAKRLTGSNFAEVEEFGATVFRQYVLQQPDADMKAIVSNALRIWKFRAGQVETQESGDE